MRNRNTNVVYWVHYPVIKLLLAFMIGSLVSHYYQFDLTLALIVAALLFVAVSVLSFKKDKDSALSTFLLFFLIATIGFLRAESLETAKKNQFETLHQLIQASDSVSVQGKIISESSNDYSWAYTLEVSHLEYPGLFEYDEPFQARLIRYKTPEDSGRFASQLNHHVQLWVTEQPVQPIRNPGQFDYASFLYSRNILAQFLIKTEISDSPPQGADKIKPLFEQSIERLFTGSNAAVAKALLIGDKTDVTNEQRLQFTRSGLAHLMAVSGLHVGFLVAPFWILIPWIWTKKFGRVLAILFLGLSLCAYAWLTGFSASVVRASIMAFLFSYAKLFEKVRYPMNIVGFAALFLLMIDPNYLFDVGFQLSFGAVSIIIMIMPTFSKLMQKQTLFYKILSSMLVGVVVQIGLSPVLALYFGEISLISPISNLFAMLPASLIVQFGLLSSVLTIFYPPISQILHYPMDFLVGLLQFFAGYFSSHDFSYAKVSQPSILFFAFWTGLLATIAAWTLKKQRWKWLTVCIFAAFLWRADILWYQTKEKPFTLTVVDVGQGDSNLIESPDGKVMLIDSGVWTQNYESGERTLLPLLSYKGIKRIHTLVLSHPHADHIGGTVSILKSVQVDTLYTDTTLAKSRSFLLNEILKTARLKQIPIKELYAGDQIHFSKEVNVRVLWPVKNVETKNLNEISTVLRMDYGETSFLFTGDAEELGESFVSEYAKEIVDTDYLKVGHHGSKSSSHIPFLEQVTPDFASVSLAKVNKYRHPHKEAMLNLQQFTSTIHFTSLNGAGVYQSDGKNISVINWREKTD